MSLTIFKGKLPAQTTVTATGDVTSDSFDKKLGALRYALGRPERFVTRCACAIHDKPFTVVYERIDPSRLIITGIFKDGDGEGVAEVKAGGQTKRREVPAAEVDHAGWRCPFCGNEQHVGCHRCRATVCGGKTRRYPGTSDVFTCRASCGARGTLIDAPTVEGVEPTRNVQASKPISERLPAPDAERLRLGGSKAPRLK